MCPSSQFVPLCTARAITRFRIQSGAAWGLEPCTHCCRRALLAREMALLLPPCPSDVNGPEWLPNIKELSSWLNSGGLTSWQCGGREPRLRVEVEFGQVVARIKLRESVEEYGQFLKTTMMDTTPLSAGTSGASPLPMVPLQGHMPAQHTVPAQQDEVYGQEEVDAVLTIQALWRKLGDRGTLRESPPPNPPNPPAAYSLGGAASGVACATQQGDSASSATSPWVLGVDAATLKELIRSELRLMAREVLGTLQTSMQ